MKKQILVLFLFIVTVSNLKAQMISVRDKVTLEKLPGVVITAGAEVALTTDQSGNVDITPFKDNPSIKFHMIGYQSVTMSYFEVAAAKWIVSLPEKSFYTNEVVVSASKFEEKRDDVAQQIQVIGQTDLRFMNQQTTGDVLNQSGNVMVQKSQQGGGSPIIRGFEANKVLIVVDGVRMNNAIYRGGHLQDVITLDNSIMEKMEVVFGPGSVVYGSDALGGVMHFYTRNPEFSRDTIAHIKGNAFVRHGTSNQELTGHADVNIGGKKFSSLSSITFSSFDDLRQGNVRSPYQLGDWGRTEYVARIEGKDSIVNNSNPNVQVGSGYKQFDFIQKLSYKQANDITHILNMQYSTSSDVPRYDRLTQYRNGALRFAEWYYGPQERLLTSYNLNFSRSNKVFDHARFILSYQDIQQSRNSRLRGKTTLESQVEDVSIIAANLDFEKVLREHEIRYGAEFTYNDVQSAATARNIETDSTWKISTRYPDGGSSMQSAAAYITHTWEVARWLIISEGARLSNVQLNANFNDTTFFPFPFKTIQQNNTALNGNVSFVFKPGADWKISLLGSTGFRAPNVDDLSKVFETAGAIRDPNTLELLEYGNLIIPNPNLKPEYTYNADFGIAKTIHKKVTIEGTTYYTLYKNAITTGRGMLNGESTVLFNGDSAIVSTSLNAANAFIYGFSGQFTAQLNNIFDISSSINYTYGRIKDGDKAETPLDHIPPVFGRTGLSMQLNKFRGELWTMYNGWKRIGDYRLGAEDNESNATAEGMPAWYTLNIRGTYQISNLLSVQLALENILDQNYRQFASNISASGRNLMVTLKARF